MFENGRKTIGVIVSDIPSHYQEHICNTLTEIAQEKGYNLLFFSFFTCYGDNTRNGRGEVNIIHLVPYDQLDALIFCFDTMSNDAATAVTWDLIREKCTCPVITFRQDSGEYPCVMFDQEHKIEEIVYHLIDEHGMKRIGFMNGPSDHPDAIARLADYRNALEKRGIDYDEKLVFEGDFWNTRAKAAAEYYTMDLPEMPEAIVCGNDYMALALSNELIDKGFLVPDQIAVTGFDDIWESSITMPPLTTVTVPIDKMVHKGMRIIEKMWAGEDVERVNFVEAEPVIRNSCGCSKLDMQSMLKKRVRQVKEHQRILEQIQINTYMFVDLSDAQNIDGIETKLRLLENSSNHVKSYFVCLGDGRGDMFPKYRSAAPGYAKKSVAVGAVMNRKPIACKGKFATANLLPKEAMESDPMIYYFYPLHCNQYAFGYLALSYTGMATMDDSFPNWLAIIGNSMESIQLKIKNQKLLLELNNLYVHDALTGLYNRRGFDNTAQSYFRDATESTRNYVIIAIDMDNLKVVNDKFGHLNGDIALKTIGQAMEHAAGEDDACARVGGDEFNMVALDYTDQEAEDYIQDFHDYLDSFNKTSGLPFLVKASAGYFIANKENGVSMEECMRRADENLYDIKSKKKEEKKDNVIREVSVW